MARKRILLSPLVLATLCIAMAAAFLVRAQTVGAASSGQYAAASTARSSSSSKPNDIVKNNVYLIVGSSSITALNATTGALLWQFQPGGYLLSTPAVVNNAVYVLVPGKSFPVLDALNLISGATLWQFQPNGYLNSPLITNVVYVTVDSATQNSSTLYALNATTGAQLWSFQPNVHLAIPVVVQSIVYISTGYPSSVYALSTSNGQQVWHSSPINSTIYLGKVSGGVLYGDAQGPNNTFGLLYAFKTSNGSFLWSNNDAALWEVVRGIAYVEEGTYASPSICALNTSSGSQLWCIAGFGVKVANGLAFVTTGLTAFQALIASTGAPVWSSTSAHFLAVAQKVVYAVDNNNFIEALQAGKGNLLWHSQTNYGAYEGPSIVNGALYILSQDYSKVYSLSAANGALHWSYPVHGGIASFTIARGVVYIAAYSGSIYAVRASDGMLLWQH